MTAPREADDPRTMRDHPDPGIPASTPVLRTVEGVRALVVPTEGEVREVVLVDREIGFLRELRELTGSDMIQHVRGPLGISLWVDEEGALDLVSLPPAPVEPAHRPTAAARRRLVDPRRRRHHRRGRRRRRRDVAVVVGGPVPARRVRRRRRGDGGWSVMGGVNSPDLATGLAAAVARLGELADVYERLDIGDGWVETPCTRAREIGADLRVVLAAAVGDDGSRCPWHGPTCDGTDHENHDPAMPLGEQAETASGGA